MRVKYKKSDTVKLIAGSKLLSGVVKNFRMNEDEITLAVTRRKATFKNHIDTYTEKNKTVRTELGLLAGEFEEYCVNESVSLTFCLKQLRAAVAFAEPAGLPVNLYFELPGRPVIFSVCNESAYEANFVVSTLTTIGESHSQGSQKSDSSWSSGVHKQPQEAKSKEWNQHKTKVVETKSLSGRSNSVNNLGDGSEENNGRISTDAGVCPSVSSDVSNYKSLVNASSTQDTVLLENNGLNLDENVLNSPQNSPRNIVNDVFGRCFNTTFKRSLLPGASNILAYDSDGLEDSD